MNNLTVKQKCLIMRNGIEIWLDEEKADKLGDFLMQSKKGLVKYEGRIINLVDVVGIYLPEDLYNLVRRKNGEWQCDHGEWHARGEECHCRKPSVMKVANGFGGYDEIII